MTQNITADPARTDPTGVFITGPTGFGKTVLARQFAIGAGDSGASVRILDTVRGGLDYQDIAPTSTHGMVESAVERLEDIFRQARPEQPTVFIFDELASALHREDRSSVDEDEQRDVDMRNRARDQLSDFVADSFVFGSDMGVFPVVVTQNAADLRLIERVKQAATGWVHFEFTGAGKGTVHTERDQRPFVLPLPTTN